jgi:hypothetical protein
MILLDDDVELSGQILEATQKNIFKLQDLLPKT